MKYHQITHVSFSDDELRLTVDGKEICLKLSDISEKLAKASSFEREKFEISSSGYGIHWPLLDEDLSIDGLLGIKHTPPQKVSAKI